MDYWSQNPFWDTLYIILQLAHLNFFPFPDHLPTSLLNQLEEICAQSWDHIEAFGDTKSLKTKKQQPCSWSRMTWNTLYLLKIWCRGVEYGKMSSQDHDQVSMKSNMFGFLGYSQMKFYRTYKTALRKELHTSSWNWMQANETACKLMKLHTSSWNFI